MYALAIIPPFPCIVNLGEPALDAVKISPTPELSTTNAAKDVLPETDAANVVPANGDCPVTINFAEVDDCPPRRVSTVELLAYNAPFV